MDGTPPDPHAVLGVPRGASQDEIRRARRRLALELHPDRGGDGAGMVAVNAAFDRLARAGTAVDPVPAGGEAPARSAGFSVDVLPVEAFHLLLPVAAELGEVLVDDPPYDIEAYLDDPYPCFCQVRLVPEAGGTMVIVSVTAAEEGPADVDAEAVTDRMIAALAALVATRAPR